MYNISLSFRKKVHSRLGLYICMSDCYYVYDTLWIKRKLRVGLVKCFVTFIDFPRQGRNLRLETEECHLAYVCARTAVCTEHCKLLFVGRTDGPADGRSVGWFGRMELGHSMAHNTRPFAIIPLANACVYQRVSTISVLQSSKFCVIWFGFSPHSLTTMCNIARPHPPSRRPH